MANNLNNGSSVQDAYLKALDDFKKDLIEDAISNFGLAANGGIYDAYYYLGVCYQQQAQTSERNYKRLLEDAVKCYEKYLEVSESDHVNSACLNLTECYIELYYLEFNNTEELSDEKIKKLQNYKKEAEKYRNQTILKGGRDRKDFINNFVSKIAFNDDILSSGHDFDYVNGKDVKRIVKNTLTDQLWWASPETKEALSTTVYNYIDFREKEKKENEKMQNLAEKKAKKQFYLDYIKILQARKQQEAMGISHENSMAQAYAEFIENERQNHKYILNYSGCANPFNVFLDSVLETLFVDCYYDYQKSKLLHAKSKLENNTDESKTEKFIRMVDDATEEINFLDVKKRDFFSTGNLFHFLYGRNRKVNNYVEFIIATNPGINKEEIESTLEDLITKVEMYRVMVRNPSSHTTGLRKGALEKGLNLLMFENNSIFKSVNKLFGNFMKENKRLNENVNRGVMDNKKYAAFFDVVKSQDDVQEKV